MVGNKFSPAWEPKQDLQGRNSADRPGGCSRLVDLKSRQDSAKLKEAA